MSRLLFHIECISMSDFSIELRKIKGKHSVFPVFALVSALVSKVVSLVLKYALNLKFSFQANRTIIQARVISSEHRE